MRDRAELADRLRRLARRCPGDAREAVRRGEASEGGAIGGGGRRIGAEQQIRAAVQQIDQNGPLAARPLQPGEYRSQRRDQGEQRRMQHRAGFEVDHARLPRRVQPQRHAGAAAAERELGAPPRSRRRACQRRNRRVGESGAAQRLRQQPGLPRGIGPIVPVLQRAAAAGAEMRAWRGDTVGRGDQHLLRDPGPTGAAPGYRADADAFAGDGGRNIDRRSVRQGGDAIALGANPLDAHDRRGGWGRSRRGTRPAAAGEPPPSRLRRR
ncbi:MAG TPA: hypothetical protein VME92_00090 [Acetobacteraceae bacterium]|nr:hypothetical protein [Acetobacteraceae bacterium]